jgi:hypothetical protein
MVRREKVKRRTGEVSIFEKCERWRLEEVKMQRKIGF